MYLLKYNYYSPFVSKNNNTIMAKTDNDKAIFQFDSLVYNRFDVEKLSFEMCEKLPNLDELNVTKFDGNNLQELLNESELDIDNSFFRVFL